MSDPKPSFLCKLLRFSFLLAALTGFMRLYGAINQQPDILTFSQKAWLPTYLMVAGGLMGLINLRIWLMLKRNLSLPAWLIRAGLLINIIAYWLERFFLWSPPQRGTNALWVLGVHLAWLLLAGFCHLQMKRRLHEHE